MSILPPPADKYDLSGIGGATAAVVMAALLANPSTSWLTAGVVGTLTNFFLTKIFSGLASVGLVFLNVGAEQIATAVQKVGFDGSFTNAFALVDQLSANGHTLTPDQIAAIDNPVIAQFEKFAKLTRTKS